MSGFFYIPTLGLFYCIDIFSKKLYLFFRKNVYLQCFVPY